VHELVACAVEVSRYQLHAQMVISAAAKRTHGDAVPSCTNGVKVLHKWFIAFTAFVIRFA